MKRVVLFSPSRFSLYTIAAAELLKRQGIDVQGIVVRRLLSPGRFFSEFRRDGTRLLKKIWKKLVLRKGAYKASSYETIADLLRQEQISFRTVDELGSRHGIPIIYCRELNEPHVVDALRRMQPDVVVFTGGGIIRQPVLEQAGAGVLNCHMGVLPPYRGMDVVEWPILDGRFDQVGMTVHFMDTGIDTGDILRISPVPVRPGETIRELRERFEPIMCRQMVGTCIDFLAGRLPRIPQKAEDGKQYFIMHPRLIEIAAARLQALSGSAPT